MGIVAYLLQAQGVICAAILKTINFVVRTLQVEQRDYLPIVDAQRKDVALPQYGIWLFYHAWEPDTNWENRYTVMSDAELMRWDASLV